MKDLQGEKKAKIAYDRKKGQSSPLFGGVSDPFTVIELFTVRNISWAD